MSTIKKDEGGNKTRWCDQCKKRHALDHEHFTNVADKAANTVTGSKSSADLADQAAKGKKSEAIARVSQQRLDQEQERKEREALERRWGRRMRMCYGFASKLLDDPKIALNDRETEDMGQVHADMCVAWGWTASG